MKPDIVEEVYPAFWPCKLCEKPFDKHCVKGQGNGFDLQHAEYWCYGDTEFKSIVAHGAKAVWRFIPLDNLTMIEKLANERKLPI